MTAPTMTDLAGLDAGRTKSARPRPAARSAEPPLLSWAWLVAGAVLTAVVGFQTSVPVAAWLAPVFLLRFFRQRPLAVALPALAVANAAALLVAMRHDFFPGDTVGLAALVVPVSVIAVLPFLADRLAAPYLGATTGTLVFPAAATVLEWAGTFGNPYGTAGSVAYSQSADLPLLQLASLTGIWGITFLVSWLAPVVNLVWEQRSRTRRAVTIFLTTVVVVLLVGGTRLALLTPEGPSVTVAALAPEPRLGRQLAASPLPRTGTAAERARANAVLLEPVATELLARTRVAAEGGAKIITWSEAAVYVFPEDLAPLLRRASAVAREEQVYLQIGVIVLLPNRELPLNENRAVLFDPSGAQVWDYAKSRPTPGDGELPGPGVLPLVRTPYGSLTTIICQDDMFPGLLRQAGRAGADLVLVPSSDWPAIAGWHAQLDPVRAVEQGTSVVRATRWGVSLAADRHGRLLARGSGAEPDPTVVASVPVGGRPTLYTVVGDLFAHLSAVALLGLLLLAARHRRASTTVARKGHDR